MPKPRPWAECATDRNALPLLLGAYAGVKMTLGRLREELELATEAVRAADRTGDRLVAGGLRAGLVLANRRLGRLSDALTAAEAGRALLPDDPTAGRDLYGVSASLQLVLCRLLVLVPIGRLREAAGELVQAVALGGPDGEVPRVGVHLVRPVRWS